MNYIPIEWRFERLVALRKSTDERLDDADLKSKYGSLQRLLMEDVEELLALTIMGTQLHHRRKAGNTAIAIIRVLSAEPKFSNGAKTQIEKLLGKMIISGSEDLRRQDGNKVLAIFKDAMRPVMKALISARPISE